MINPPESFDILAWEELTDAANEAFNIWSGQPELRWAEEAWSILAAAGLTTYTTPLARARVACRFFALAAIYLDFCYLAYDEDVDANYEGWTSLLELHPFHIGQLVGPDQDFVDTYGDLDINDAVRLLANSERDVVYDALLAHYGSVSELFMVLSRTCENDEDEDENSSARDRRLVDDISFAGVEAFTWLSERCYSLYPRR